MAEYINRDIWKELPDDLPYKASVKRVLISAPAADVVEVVRCRDCKYYKINPYGEESERMCKCWGDYLPTNADDFCSYGERKPD